MLNQDPKKEIPLTPAGSPVDLSERIFGLLATLLISVQRRLPMNMTRKSSALLLGVTILALAIAGISATALAQTPGLSAPIEGSWISVITGTQDPPLSFTSLSSFAAGGVFVGTGSNDRVNPVSPLYGSWKRIGPNSFGVTTFFFAFGPTGTAVAMLRSNQILQLENSDELVGVGELSSCDLEGENCNPIVGANIKIAGKRILVPKNLVIP
jgi:hypothetical protein